MKKTNKMREIEERFGEPIKDILLREYLGKRRTLDEAAKALGVTQGTLSGWCFKLGIPTRSWAWPEQVE
jgi:hypothetical protein